MKKYIVFLSMVSLMGCSYDPLEEVDPITVVPESLIIHEVMGLKLESIIVTDEVNINTKLPLDGVYKLRILDIGNELISQEKITADKGDNLLKIYVGSLPISSYTIELRTEDNTLLGREVFVISE